MTLTDILTAIGTVAAVFGAIVAVADMKDEGRARLKRWAIAGYRVANFLYAVTAFGIGALGIGLFYASTEPATRRDIVHMLVFVLDIAIGCWRFWAMADAVEKSKKEGSSALTSNSSTA